MRETGVRVCVGCERMLPTTELIRVARLADPVHSGDAEGNAIDVDTEGEEEKKKKKEETKKNGSSSKCKWSVAIDPGSVAGSDALLRMLVDDGVAAAAAKHPAAAAAARRFSKSPDSRDDVRSVRSKSKSRRRPTNALQGLSLIHI